MMRKGHHQNGRCSLTLVFYLQKDLGGFCPGPERKKRGSQEEKKDRGQKVYMGKESSKGS